MSLKYFRLMLVLRILQPECRTILPEVGNPYRANHRIYSWQRIELCYRPCLMPKRSRITSLSSRLPLGETLALARVVATKCSKRRAQPGNFKIHNEKNLCFVACCFRGAQATAEGVARLTIGPGNADRHLFDVFPFQRTAAKMRL